MFPIYKFNTFVFDKFIHFIKGDVLNQFKI